ncbi:elongation factor G-binding protein, partial [Priestia megaterium]|uniref:elongation factor G-binding protein n=1 Tax=Priestia megaterium TaxID=1404 RepID=UPI00064CD30F
MEPFIKSYQFNFIEMQTQNWVNGHASVNDEAVLKALRYSSQDKTLNLFPDIDKQQMDLLNSFIEIKEKLGAERFLLKLRPYIISFKEETEKTVKKI